MQFPMKILSEAYTAEWQAHSQRRSPSPRPVCFIGITLVFLMVAHMRWKHEAHVDLCELPTVSQ